MINLSSRIFENIDEIWKLVTELVILIGYVTIINPFLTLKSFFEKRQIFEFAKNHKGPKFYPIIGNLNEVIGRNIFELAQKGAERYGIPCNVWFGHDYYYFSDDASEIKIILNHPNAIEKGTIYNDIKVLFRNALLLAPGDIWKRKRKFFAKNFSQPILNSFVPIYYKKSISLVNVLKEPQNKDIYEILERYTLDSFCETLIGIDYDLQIDPKVKFLEWVGELQDIGGKRLVSSYYYPTVLWIFSSEGRRFLWALYKARSFIFSVLRNKRKELAENPVSNHDKETTSLLDAMLQAEGTKMSNQEIFNDIFLLSIGATDPAGFSLAFTFTLLGMHPDVQEKVYQEVLSVIGSTRPIYHKDLPNLKYTEQAIFEAMRLLPSVPLEARLATADIDLGTKIFPKGANFAISIFDLHRNEKYWPNPLVYDPDRFLPEEVAKRHQSAFVPFSGGARNCVGKTYGIMLIKTAVAHVVRNFKISSKYKSVSELSLTSCITMKTTHPLDCKFEVRVTE